MINRLQRNNISIYGGPVVGNNTFNKGNRLEEGLFGRPGFNPQLEIKRQQVKNKAMDVIKKQYA
ncbi:MAG: hypothetical protein LBV33_00865, partial [Lachnospiraceae bacterium]|nr:hypothetical protein [Lachnospiraceae bacterium]